ncbi:hypothetical protein E2320_017768 [Naja naja]|nr:hypothetical protein E2320_017768 [Naja naja]
MPLACLTLCKVKSPSGVPSAPVTNSSPMGAIAKAMIQAHQQGLLDMDELSNCSLYPVQLVPIGNGQFDPQLEPIPIKTIHEEGLVSQHPSVSRKTEICPPPEDKPDKEAKSLSAENKPPSAPSPLSKLAVPAGESSSVPMGALKISPTELNGRTQKD